MGVVRAHLLKSTALATNININNNNDDIFIIKKRFLCNLITCACERDADSASTNKCCGLVHTRNELVPINSPANSKIP